MTPHDQAHHAPLDDAAAYALGALEPDEEMRLQDHLLGCAECREEAAEMRLLVGTLAMSAPQFAAPAALRNRVLRSIATEQPSRDRRRHDGAHWFGALAGRPVYAAALGVIVAIAVALAVALPHGASDGTRLLQARVQGSAGQAELQLNHGRGTLVVRHFPAPAPGHVYEVWLRRASGRPTPTQTLFSVTAAGAANVGVSDSLEGVRAILVTQEPAGGSTDSTHRPLIVAPVI